MAAPVSLGPEVVTLVIGYAGLSETYSEMNLGAVIFVIWSSVDAVSESAMQQVVTPYAHSNLVSEPFGMAERS